MDPKINPLDIVFIIPLLHPKHAKDYKHKIKLLCKTLKSIGNQTCRNFRIVVIHNKSEYDWCFKDYHNDYTDFVSVNLEPLKPPNLKYYINKYYSKVKPSYVLTTEIRKRIMLCRIDHGCRNALGLKHAQQYDPKYIMFCDADDYISNKIVETIHKYPKCNGWFINKGYKCDARNYSNIYQRDNFHDYCGTSFIMKAKLLYEPENIKCKCNVIKIHEWLDKEDRTVTLNNKHLNVSLLSLTMKHNEILDILDPIYILYMLALHKPRIIYFDKIEYPLKPFPLFGAIYLINQNDSILSQKGIYGPKVKNIDSIYKEFGLK